VARATATHQFMDGVLVIDKPSGITSHDVVSLARRCLGERRIGHTGTLDPLATGVLPLACGQATRLVRFLTASDKDYEAAIRFGIVTDSYDITGREVARSAEPVTRAVIERALASLRGEYLQMPPAYSAKKVGGQRAYALARQDVPVALTPVPVHVARADLVDLEGTLARVTLTCSAGFYVRSLAHELGARVGPGACLETLRRTRSGAFGLDEALTVEALTRGEDVASRVIPLDRLLPELPAARLGQEGCNRVSHGQDVGPAHILEWVPAAQDDPTWVRLLDERGHLVALARPGGSAGALHPTVVLN
jgi:tRNA pseudouridine55 synthase